MKVVLQRVKEASVTVREEKISEIQKGFLLLVGITHEDTEEDVKYLVNKIVHLRVFEDENEKMNRSIKDVDGGILSVSQFTLYGDTKKGRRPSFIKAAKPAEAEALYNTFNQALRTEGVITETGEFGAMMDVQLVNDGPVTLILDSKDR
ncbi:D-aminoacyl-tRNA deacylase [Oceanobacillus oncorhynchi subsp. incaldanensis]|uniref:D-aminoacyl-tRNA deacylase n=2 Tax=Oceanobacillus TaxID=182709 RepID=A0A0A1MLD0_9BACI|nr:D-aminoacyl-tRNA deacylase [Oceanobacillus oncorhynchi]MDM8100431.1 D-aminoacyl-tRNA deacylase [Oceanobacillus oncorhynchi]UUI38201.1 D-aminoacyl-tRNA deacylase [Oceanobacillus oncorhynchi]GIO17088.1 D-aminoacyl-tRNA deacylase [Oceanobacillus oncorhynchi subsp. incaldanensis]CEI83863.1 D-tyrosyl-tRNA(Tyr) deacylase [Oceanobacillus oncorhynchi]